VNPSAVAEQVKANSQQPTANSHIKIKMDPSFLWDDERWS
jgi:hypothetical protein